MFSYSANSKILMNLDLKAERDKLRLLLKDIKSKVAEEKEWDNLRSKSVWDIWL